MKRSRWLIFLVVFFLVQYIVPSEILSGPDLLLPQMRTDPGSSEHFFPQIYKSICIGISMYVLDAIEGYSKEKLIATFRSTGGRLVKFDLENIDIGKKGWIRHYPFSIGNKNFIMRIFLTAERSYQPEAKVLYEGKLAEPEVTFQILPSLNEMLADCSAKPFKIYSPSQAERSP